MLPSRLFVPCYGKCIHVLERRQNMRTWFLIILALVGGCAKKSRPPEMSLEQAARQGNLQQVQWLIARGASVNAQTTRWGSTPLEAAAAGGHVEVAQVLIACGANVRAVDDDGI